MIVFCMAHTKPEDERTIECGRIYLCLVRGTHRALEVFGCIGEIVREPRKEGGSHGTMELIKIWNS